MRATAVIALALVFAPASAAAQICPPGQPSRTYCPIGRGVAYRTATPSTGSDVFIAYGGYGASLDASKSWADALCRARLAAAGVRHVYAVQGPARAGYQDREIANSALLRHLQALAGAARRIIVVAHSSGGFVANELLARLGGLAAKLHYFDLDGAAPAGLNLAARGAKLYFIYAEGPKRMRSMNASVAAGAGRYGGRAVKVDGSASGCRNARCLHDAVITSRPHNPLHFDVARDYTQFTGGRTVVTSYLDRLAPANAAGSTSDRR